MRWIGRSWSSWQSGTTDRRSRRRGEPSRRQDARRGIFRRRRRRGALSDAWWSPLRTRTAERPDQSPSLGVLASWRLSLFVARDATVELGLPRGVAFGHRQVIDHRGPLVAREAHSPAV